MTLTHIYEIRSALQPHICNALFDFEIAPHYIIYVCGHKFIVMDFTGDLEDASNILTASVQIPNDFSGVAVLNCEIKTTPTQDQYDVLRNQKSQYNLMCDFVPKTNIFICNGFNGFGDFQYDSDAFTRNAPLNLITPEITFGSLIFDRPPNMMDLRIRRTATIIYLTPSTIFKLWELLRTHENRIHLNIQKWPPKPSD